MFIFWFDVIPLFSIARIFHIVNKQFSEYYYDKKSLFYDNSVMLQLYF